MMGMSIPYEMVGRREQKARTRRALVDAARVLIGQGMTPSVEQAAAAASISRTTAYRYFANQEALLVAAFPHIERDSLLPEPAPVDPQARLAVVVEAHTRQTLEIEPQLRAMLRIALETDGPQRDALLLRRGRAIGWIAEAIAPLSDRMSPDELHRLALAIRAAEGIEALVWLTDVGPVAGSGSRDHALVGPRHPAVGSPGWAALGLIAPDTRSVPKELRPFQRCKTAEPVPKHLMQSPASDPLPLRDDHRIGSDRTDTQYHLSPNCAANRRLVHSVPTAGTLLALTMATVVEERRRGKDHSGRDHRGRARHLAARLLRAGTALTDPAAGGQRRSAGSTSRPKASTNRRC
jgi:AcrR family transcriptional regulator